MDLNMRVGFYRLGKITIYIVCVAVLAGCYSIDKTATPATSTFSVQVSTAPYLTETPIPACVSLPNVKLDVMLLPDNAVQIKVTGLQPNELVYMVFSSESQGKVKRIECCAAETAIGDGSYNQVQVLRGQSIDVEFKHWQVHAVHSRGSTCAEFVLP